MIPLRRSALALTTLLFLGALTRDAAADPYAYEIGPFRTTGYSASWIHDARRAPITQPDGRTYWMGGRKLWSLEGSILGDRDLSAGRIDFTGGSLAGVSQGESGLILGIFDAAKDIAISVDGGYFVATGPDGRPEGFVRTTWEQDGNSASVDFYIAPYPFSGPANDFLEPNLGTFAVWGNNTRSPLGFPVRDTNYRLGADLYGRGGPAPMPEPGTLALLGTLAAAVAARRRARNRASS